MKKELASKSEIKLVGLIESENDFGGDRAYIADFKVYDERAVAPANASLDYIGIKS